jgi:hypothetical protein
LGTLQRLILAPPTKNCYRLRNRYFGHVQASVRAPDAAAQGRPVSSRRESHPPALSEPDVNLSIHPAPTTLAACMRHLGSINDPSRSRGCPSTNTGWPVPFAPPALPGFIATTGQSAPASRFGTLPLTVSAVWGSSFASGSRFSRSMQEPKPGSRHLYAGYRLVSKQVSSRLVPRHPCSLGFDIVIRGFDASSNGSLPLAFLVHT